MTVSIVVIGAGQFGIEHLRAYAAMPDVEIVGVMDADPARASEVAARFGTLALPPGPTDADAVSLVVPVHSRGVLTAELLAGGQSVFIEKPLAATGDAAEALVEAARGRVAMVGHVLRFAEPYRLLRDATAELGTLTGGHLSRRRSADHFSLYPADDVVDLTMIHDLDAATWLAGARATSVSATGTRGDDGRWACCRAELVHADGASWVVEAEWSGEVGEQEDRAVVSGAAGEASVVVSAADAEAVYSDALAAELGHFIDQTRLGAPSARLAMSDAAFAVRLADAVRASLEREGAAVGLDH